MTKSSFQLIVEVNHQNNPLVRIVFHFIGMDIFEFIYNIHPTTSNWQNSNNVYINIGIVDYKAARNLTISIIFRQDVNMPLALIRCHSSTSPRIKAFTRSPTGATSLSILTKVGSR